MQNRILISNAPSNIYVSLEAVGDSTDTRGLCHYRPLARLLHFSGSDTVAH